MAVIALVGTICSTPYTYAQIIEFREYRGKTITCALSGLRGWGSPCGIDSNCAYIFVGSVLSATEMSETEKHLQLGPQEIFLGDATKELTVTTNQGACLREILPGDEWLFYLSRDEKTDELLLQYESPSEPVANAEPAINTLRRLAAMTDSGLVVGSLYREVHEVGKDGTKWSTAVPVPNHKVIAKRASDAAEYSALTDSDGDYEFEPLPSGSYHLSTNTTKGLWAEEGPTTVHSRGCTAYRFELHSDGGISGRVTPADGKTFKIHRQVEVESEDGDHFESFSTDDNGYFEARGLEPGRYLVGNRHAGSAKQSRVAIPHLFPWRADKRKATIIELGKAEKRTNIDFQLSSSTSR